MISDKIIKDGLGKQESLKSGPHKHSSSSTPGSSRSSGETQKNISLDLTPLYEIWGNLKTDILNRGDKPKYPTGLKALDDILWGLHKKELMTIGGRTSQGKTALAVFLTKALVDAGSRMIYFSLEMSKEQLLERFLCNLCRINNLKLRRGQGKEDIKHAEKMFEEWITSAKLLIDDSYGYSFENIVKICEIIKPDFIVIDYIQMISTYGYRNKLDAIEEYIRKIKQLSIEMNFGTILISQINRTNKDNPNMSGFKWSGSLEETSDTALTLKWDWSDVVSSRYFINVEKQRHGEVKNGVEVNFIPEYSDFQDIHRRPNPQVEDRTDLF